jgi:hypothetical protein
MVVYRMLASRKCAVKVLSSDRGNSLSVFFVRRASARNENGAARRSSGAVRDQQDQEARA